MQKFKTTVINLIKKIRRYPSELRVMGNEYVEYDMDNMIISGPMHTYNYLWSEYILSTFFSIAVIFSIILYIFADNSPPLNNVTLLQYWLNIGLFWNLLALVPKFLILRRLYKIPLHNERLVVRRLMFLIRSNAFFWNEKVSFVMYNFYIFGMGKLASSRVCGGMNSNLYRLCHFIIASFLVRLANLFIRFLIEYYFYSRNVQYDSLMVHEATQEEINSIPTEKLTVEDLKKLTEKTEEQWCGICLSLFTVNDEIKRLPCSEKHFFHKQCTDTWLAKQSVCPYCRRQLSFSAS